MSEQSNTNPDPIFKFRDDLLETYVETFEVDEVSAYHLIMKASPKERLETYLSWNGIIGYTNAIYDIAMGKFSA